MRMAFLEHLPDGLVLLNRDFRGSVLENGRANGKGLPQGRVLRESRWRTEHSRGHFKRSKIENRAERTRELDRKAQKAASIYMSRNIL